MQASRLSVLKLNSQAFSLIELMIVVVIIGILASIAIPSYQGFQRKAKDVFAKTTLSAIYTAEKVYYAEHDAYSASLLIIGISPAGLGNQDFFATGFRGANHGVIEHRILCNLLPMYQDFTFLLLLLLPLSLSTSPA